MRIIKSLATILIISSLILINVAQANTKLLSDPALSNNKIAFVYAGDIWLANTDGSSPRRVASSSADESAPHFSPDGKWLAYSANHDNNQDVYLVSTAGGQPKRLTWHLQADTVRRWSADGKRILFTSRREMKIGRGAQAWEIGYDVQYIIG